MNKHKRLLQSLELRGSGFDARSSRSGQNLDLLAEVPDFLVRRRLVALDRDHRPGRRRPRLGPLQLRFLPLRRQQ